MMAALGAAVTVLIAFAFVSRSDLTAGHGKMTFSKPAMQIDRVRRTAKLSLPVEAHIEIPEETVEPNVPFHLNVTVERTSLPSDFSYELRLPKSVHLHARGDAVSGKVVFPEGEMETQLSFELLQSSSKNEKLYLVLHQGDGGKSIKRFRINTLRFHELQTKNQKLLERQEEYLKLNPDILKIQK